MEMDLRYTCFLLLFFPSLLDDFCFTSINYGCLLPLVRLLLKYSFPKVSSPFFLSDLTLRPLFLCSAYLHDYLMLSRNMGHKHYAVWNDTTLTFGDGEWFDVSTCNQLQPCY